MTSVLENGNTGYGVLSVFRIFFFFDCWIEFSIAISKGSFASVRIEGNPSVSWSLYLTGSLF